MPEINGTTRTNPSNANVGADAEAPVVVNESSQPTPASLNAIYTEYSRDGWTDSELRSYISEVVQTPDVQPYLKPLWNAVMNPAMPGEAHSDPKFFEVLAWYIDKSTTARGDGKLTLQDVEESLNKYGQQYLQLSQDPTQSVSRLQAWKFVQKLRILEKEINTRSEAGLGAYYPYSPRDMMEIDANSTFNRENTIRSRAAFDEKIIEASYDKPVLVKFGLTYCAHCLLLEQLGSVPAVAEKYSDSMDVFKLWWNPHDTEYAQLNQIAGEQNVTSSPLFILFKDGAAVKSGYAFPDEKGEGMEEFLAGHLDD